MTNKYIKTEKVDISIHPEGFCIIKFRSGSYLNPNDIYELGELNDQILDLARELGRTDCLVDGLIPFVVVDIREVMGMSKGAREAATRVNRDTEAGGVAVVSNSAMGRMIGNFFINFNRPKFPIRMFQDEEEAFAWLRSLK